MKGLIVALICISMLFVGCITSGTKVKLTDKETGNSVTVSEEGVSLDINKIEKDGVVVEIESE